MSALLAVIASVTGLLRAWPQAFGILRGGDISGVSAQAWTLMLISNATWIVLGVVDDIPLLVAYNVASGAGTAAVVVLACRRGQGKGSLVVVALTVSALVNAGVLALWGAAGVGTLAAGLAIFMFLPQAYKVLRQPAVGVSRASWGLALISAAAWGWYGLLIGQGALIAAPLVMVPAALLILWRAEPADAGGAQPSPGGTV